MSRVLAAVIRPIDSKPQRLAKAFRAVLQLLPIAHYQSIKYSGSFPDDLAIVALRAEVHLEGANHEPGLRIQLPGFLRVVAVLRRLLLYAAGRFDYMSRSAGT